ncbi:PREDICTED: E3 ubiquitin-protein ligase RHA2A-like [Nelumbo nucifera]|uniref:E3 ubiquitin-protein ligase RHA2A-like n=1 Tax=Nelumbo nucifera TaxID=4432 RepID=A0A1U8BD34_NELNU|nr:PREDICTED: E3 ubiquitin-protein ligase RHA2A-like [Nelumbo nucifera]
MGLYSHLSDVSSDSIPLLLVAIVANCVNYLRSLLFEFLQSMGFSRFLHVEEVGDGLLGAVGSGLAGLIVLADQLKVNGGVSSYCGSDDGEGTELDCVVCLCRLKDGDQVRRLECRHVFHKDCLDGWLNHLNWNCPLCRSPLVSEERLAATERRVAADLVTWFSMR